MGRDSEIHNSYEFTYNWRGNESEEIRGCGFVDEVHRLVQIISPTADLRAGRGAGVSETLIPALGAKYECRS